MSIRYEVVVGLRFHRKDVLPLRELAKQDWTHDPDERSVFDKAADAAESGTLLVVQTMTNDSLQEIVALFSLRGIQAQIEELESAPRRGLKLRV